MNLSENFVKSIAIDADQVYNNRATKSGRNMQRINPGAGLPETAFKLYHWLEHALEFMGIGSTEESTNVDAYGYNYGTKFKNFDTDFYWFGPVTLEGAGTYYKDPISGSYYNDFFYNNNVPYFGGDGSLLQPIHVKSIFDADSAMLSGTYHFPNHIQSEVRNIITSGYSEIYLDDDEIYLNSNSSVLYNAYLSLDSADIQMGYANNLTSSYGDFLLSGDTASISLNNSMSIGANGQFLIYSKTGVLESGMLISNTSQVKNGHIKLIADPLDAVQSVKINIEGLNTYVDLAAATTAGLVKGDLFIVGNVLNIVP
jgi:hypothetical protein